MSRDYDEQQRHRSGRESDDLVLSPGQQAFVQDGTKGVVSVYTGPNKTSLSQTDEPVLWEPRLREYRTCNQQEAIQPYVTADEGSYIVLRDPSSDPQEQHPQAGKVTANIKLLVGRSINIPGPASFALWPGQSASVLPGHRLRVNEYLVARVTNEEEARQNWAHAVVRPQSTELVSSDSDDEESDTDPIKTKSDTDTNSESSSSSDSDADNTSLANSSSDDVGVEFSATSGINPSTLTIGQLIIVKGTDVSFYIPPTGIEVERDDESGQYVRGAVTLERLEYCILLDESGDKRYVQGPAVVFPEPTESFVQNDDGTLKSKVIELNSIQGIYVKVIAPYEDALSGKSHKAGDELFITGKDQAIYYPREEHSIIRYDDQEKHHAIAVPEGEGRYVLDRMNGKVELVEGPTMLLPNPTHQVLVRRILTEPQVRLMFPGNDEAIRINSGFLEEAHRRGLGSTDFITARDTTFRGDRMDHHWNDDDPDFETRSESASIHREQMTRRSVFNRPPTVSIDDKYESAIRIDVWPGYAVRIVDKVGKHRTLVGPGATLLEFSEMLLPLTLSTGQPKNDDEPIRTPYLKVANNTVSDMVTATTKDLFEVRMQLSYRVNFAGDDPEKWFEVDNYVKFLTDHLRSRLRHMIRGIGIEEFHTTATDAIRDTILGVATDDTGKRPGLIFEENGMHVYDTEVLHVELPHEVRSLLQEDQQQAVVQRLQISRLERDRDMSVRKEQLQREIVAETHETRVRTHEISMAETACSLEQEIASVSNQAQVEARRQDAIHQLQETLDAIAQAQLSREEAIDNHQVAVIGRKADIATASIATQLKAVSPTLIEAMQTLGDKGLATEAIKSMGPLSPLGMETADILRNIVGGLGLDRAITAKQLQNESNPAHRSPD